MSPFISEIIGTATLVVLGDGVGERIVVDRAVVA